MTDVLAAMSHQIQRDESVVGAENPKKATKAAKAAKALPPTTAPAPNAAPKAAPKAQTKAHEAADEEKRRQNLLSKIDGYLEPNKPLRQMIGEKLAQEIEDTLESRRKVMTADVLEEVYTRIVNALRSTFKRRMVEQGFRAFLTGSEKFMVQFLQYENLAGIADAAYENKEDLFEPELSELAIELDNSMVPGPKLRLGLKLVEFASAFMNSQIQACRHYTTSKPLYPDAEKDDDDDFEVPPNPFYPPTAQD